MMTGTTSRAGHRRPWPPCVGSATIGPPSARRGRPSSRRSPIPDATGGGAPERRGFIKVYGLERSGTNYLTWAMRRAYKGVCVLVDETGWKHGEIPSTVDWTGRDWSDPAWPEPARRRHATIRLRRLGGSLAALQAACERGLAICAVAKNPYAWVSSFSHYRGLPCSPVRPDMILRWNHMNRHYLDHALRQPTLATMLRYEDLISDARSVLDNVAAQHGLTRSGCARLTTSFQMNFFAKPGSRTFERDKYAKCLFMDAYDQHDIEAFREYLDRDLCSALSYDVFTGIHTRAAVVDRMSP